MMTYAEIEAALRERGTSIYHPVMGAFERRGHKEKCMKRKPGEG